MNIERADGRAKFFTKVVGPEVLTEGGNKQQLTTRRKAERAQEGWGRGGRSRRAATGYTDCRTGTGNLRGWLAGPAKRTEGSADGCGGGYEGGEMRWHEEVGEDGGNWACMWMMKAGQGRAGQCSRGWI